MHPRIFECQWVLLLCSVIATIVSATRHTFTAHNEKPLIGPIGVPFGFLKNGHFEIEVSDYKMTMSSNAHHLVREPEEILSSVEGGFYLKRYPNEAAFNQFMDVLRSNATICAFESFLSSDDYNDYSSYRGDDGLGMLGGMDEPYDDLYFENGIVTDASDGIFLSSKVIKRYGNYSLEYRFKPDEEGLYILMYQVCPMEPDVLSSFRLDFHFDNRDMLDNKTYLSAGEMNLPLLYLYFAISYVLCFGIWYTNIRLIQSGKPGHFAAEGQRPVIYHIHQLMSVLLVLKFLTLFFESIRYYALKVHGQAVLWSTFYYTISFVKGIFLFTVILLIGTGWSFVKPFINDREKKVIFVILVLQVINNLAILVLSQETEGESSYRAWTGILHIVDIVCCCAVLVPIVWQVNEIEKSMGLDDADGVDLVERETALESSDKGDILSKLKLFRTFYLMVIGYIYSTRILVFLFASFLSFKRIWVKEFVIEMITLAFYVLVGMLFRPVPESGTYQKVLSDDAAAREVELPTTSNGNNSYKTH